MRAHEPLRLELVRREVRRDAAVRDHRPAAVKLDQGHHDAVPAHRRRAEDVDGPPEQVGLDKLARAVGSALADEARLGAERCSPGGDVRRLATGAGPGLPVRVVALGERPVQLHDDVQQQVAEGADHPFHA